MQNKTEFVLVKKETEATDVVSLYFKTVDNEKYQFKAGQYVDIRLPSINGHGKSYTISSTPADELVRITIKRQGVVSSAIIDMRIGESVFFEGPYGVFYPEEEMDDVVMLAAGIGITPFYSVIRDRLETGKIGNITLIYSNKAAGNIAFRADLELLAENNKKLTIVNCLTQENNIANENKRIDQEMIKRYVPPVDNRNYFICGSISFVSDTWRTLKSIGVAEENIFTESFY